MLLGYYAHKLGDWLGVLLTFYVYIYAYLIFFPLNVVCCLAVVQIFIKVAMEWWQWNGSITLYFESGGGGYSIFL